MTTRYDLVIFGASGFTGEFVVEEVATNPEGKSWAVAGRSEAKLRQTLVKVSTLSGIDLTSIPIIIADFSDVDSLNEMAKLAKVVINCVGPYRFYGEPVVKACIEHGANHVDISGEPQFLATMQLKYNEVAKQQGVFVIGSCGWDSIPCEIGLNFVREKMPGDFNGAEVVCEINEGPKGTSYHSGSLQSALHIFANRNELTRLSRQLFPSPIPSTPFGMPARSPLSYHDTLHRWCLPFQGDEPVVERSQYFNYEHRRWRPASIKAYLKMKSLGEALQRIAFFAFILLMGSFELGRKALEKWPRLLTFGLFSHEGPTREQLAEVKFTTWFFANGWLDRVDNPDEQHTSTPDQRLVCRVDGPDPGYKATAVCVVASALTILDERQKMIGGGGVLPPGAAFAGTSILSRLNERGVKFSVVEGPKSIIS